MRINYRMVERTLLPSCISILLPSRPELLRPGGLSVLALALPRGCPPLTARSPRSMRVLRREDEREVFRPSCNSLCRVFFDRSRSPNALQRYMAWKVCKPGESGRKLRNEWYSTEKKWASSCTIPSTGTDRGAPRESRKTRHNARTLTAYSSTGTARRTIGAPEDMPR